MRKLKQIATVIFYIMMITFMLAAISIVSIGLSRVVMTTPKCETNIEVTK